MWSDAVIRMIGEGIIESLYMTAFSTLFGYVLGMPWGIALAVSGKEGIHPSALLYRILDVLAMLILLLPFTRLIVGTTIGSTATIVPLTISAAPMIARMVESSLAEVDRGVVEAAESMGAGVLFVIRHVLLVEARISLIAGATISFATVLGYSAMAGVVGGGGLGDIAIRYGYYRYQTDIMIVTVALLVLLVQIFQWLGNHLALTLDRRKK